MCSPVLAPSQDGDGVEWLENDGHLVMVRNLSINLTLPVRLSSKPTVQLFKKNIQLRYDVLIFRSMFTLLFLIQIKKSYIII